MNYVCDIKKFVFRIQLAVFVCNNKLQLDISTSVSLYYRRKVWLTCEDILLVKERSVSILIAC